MPLTPRFELSQTETHVFITIFVPTVRLTNIEVLVEESDSTVFFHASPYLLQLQFAPQKFHPDEDGNVSAEYDPSSQTIRVPIRKAQVGVDWPNLDLTARLLAPKEIPRQWLHAVVSNSDDKNENENENENGTEADLKESLDAENDSKSTSHFSVTGPCCHGYGFGGIFQNIFTDYCRAGLAQEMLQLPDPETTEPMERRQQRIEKESADFDSDRYLQDMDLDEDYLYPMVMEYQPYWSTLIPTTSITTTSSSSNNNNDKNTHDTTTIDSQLSSQFQQQMNLHPSFNKKDQYFGEAERLQLATIPYPLLPTYLQSTNEDSTLWAGLIDLLVPFVYDHLTTMGDPTVESAWTITTLSSSLSWLDPPTSIAEATVTCSRRILIYPYWRNYDFCRHVWKNTLALLQSGLHTVVKALLQTRAILEKSESYYVGNKLFVDPYLYWIQNHNDRDIPSQIIDAIQQELSSLTVLKQALNLGLLELEEENHVASNNESSDEKSESSNQESDSESGSDDDCSSSSCNNVVSCNNKHETATKNGTQPLDQEQESETGTPLLEVAQVSQGPTLLLDDVVGTSTTTSMLEIVAATSVEATATNNGGNGTPLMKKTGPLIVECD